MPDQLSHLSQAQHNENFVQTFDLDKTGYLDWVVTGIFYAGVHYVESFLATKGFNSGNHMEREKAIMSYPELDPIINDYRTLKDESVEARYKIRKFFPSEVKDLLKGEFLNLKQHILKIAPPSP